jgi:hypothetical protein
MAESPGGRLQNALHSDANLSGLIPRFFFDYPVTGAETKLLSGPEGPEPALGRLSMNTTTGILGQMRLLWAFGRA